MTIGFWKSVYLQELLIRLPIKSASQSCTPCGEVFYVVHWRILRGSLLYVEVLFFCDYIIAYYAAVVNMSKRRNFNNFFVKNAESKVKLGIAPRNGGEKLQKNFSKWQKNYCKILKNDVKLICIIARRGNRYTNSYEERGKTNGTYYQQVC